MADSRSIAHSRLRWVGALLLLSILATSAVAEEAGKVWRIGFLSSGNPIGTPHLAAFMDGLRERGYEEGKNVHIEHRWIDRDLERMPELASELVNLPVDVLVAWSSVATAGAKKASSTTPIVMIAISDPVGQGFVASLAKPGGNVTGMSNMLRGVVAKNLEALAKVAPGAKSFAVFRNPRNPSHPLVLQEAEAAARELGVRLKVVDVGAPDEIERAFVAVRKERVGGILIFGDPMYVQQRRQIADLARQARLPSITIFRQYAEAGGLMTYGLNTTDHFRRGAYFVDKIIKGANPADLPVEQPTTFEMVVNLKTARAIKATIPNEILIRAEKVIQ